MIPVVLAALVYASPPPSGSGDDTAAQRAIEAYAEQRWDDAIVALEEAYAEDPDPKYVFARAEALRAAGRCEEAIAGFEAFLEQAADAAAEAKAQAEDAIAQCRETLGRQQPPPPTPPVDDAELEGAHGPAAPPDDDGERPPPRWTRDAWGHGLTWSGSGDRGGGRRACSARRIDDRPEPTLPSTSGPMRTDWGPAPTLSRVGIPLLAIGSAVLTAGITRFIWVARSGDAGGHLAGRTSP